MNCLYCQSEVFFAAGGMTLEREDVIFFVHEECYQMSGQDGGLIESIYKMAEGWSDDEDLYSTYS